MQSILSLVPYYISWHYSRGIKDLLKLWMNFLWFPFHFFSIGLLLKTLFSPFQRLQEKYKGGLDVEDYFATITVNFMMRIVGFFVRAFTIVLGLIFFLATLLCGVVLMIAWILLPLVIIFTLVVSIRSLLNF